MCVMKKRTNVFFDDEDRANIAVIRKHYGFDSDASAIRFILQKEARDIQRKEKKDSPTK